MINETTYHYLLFSKNRRPCIVDQKRRELKICEIYKNKRNNNIHEIYTQLKSRDKNNVIYIKFQQIFCYN